MSASTPRPVIARKSEAVRRRRVLGRRLTIARASGCSLSTSTPAGQPEHLVASMSRAGDAGDDVAALGQGAGLVEQHGGDGPHPFEREAILDEDPVAGRNRGGERDHERDREAERVRAGDHQTP